MSDTTKRGEMHEFRKRLFQAGAAVGVAAAASVLGTATAFAAGSGYTPSGATATPAGVPGGFTSVLTTGTVQPSGGTVTGSENGDTITVTVPAGALTQTAQVVLTAGNVSQIGSAGQAGKDAVVAVGISVMENGSKFTGTFAKPITVTIAGNFAAGDEVVVYDPTTGGWSPVAGATIANGTATFEFTSDPDFAVLASTSSAVSGATSASTGKPFLLEGGAAAALVVGGSLFAWRFRRPRQPRRA
ncbi:MAG: hypothetical protein M0029_07580 [Actinomycetota bacterium]|nr:hypothetical protein [Actinomycetota bacterium]